MNQLFLTHYTVKGIKTLDQPVSLSFYKKTITKPIDTQGYNIKGIYGMNGSGKSGIITSVDILRKLLTNIDYLNNPVVQKSLDAIINKYIHELHIEVEYILKIENKPLLFKYKVVLGRNVSRKYVLQSELLSARDATSRTAEFKTVIEVNNGDIIFMKNDGNNSLPEDYKTKTTNLLSTSSISSLFYDKFVLPEKKLSSKKVDLFYLSLLCLFILGKSIYVYMDKSDDHTNYFIRDMVEIVDDSQPDKITLDSVVDYLTAKNSNHLNVFSTSKNIIDKRAYSNFENTVLKLQEFIRIFKPDLVRIDIEKQIDEDSYICNLLMVYKSYTIDAEFESTGVKKLIRLFTYFRKTANGSIVFIDELDSNLHDVYLCALLEYLMDYGKGQLCFTTHNVGPMDILKRHKKSIDFLSLDHKIYPWTKNGNYSPAKLYRSGMIEGSPFNVDSIDFIGIFDSPKDNRLSES